MAGGMTSEKLVNINALANADWLNNCATQNVFNALNRDGYEARAVGGAIRNTLLGRTIKDIDLATTALPEISSQLAERAGLKVIPTGLQHGTVTIISEGIPYEVTTLRQDVETDGRRAKVAFTDCWKSDASRRDFTMNALYVDQSGKLHDPLNGYGDLMEKRVRFIGSPVERIREDYLRILRYFRFKAEYGLDTLDIPSLEACVRERGGLRQLSAERISAELIRLLIAPSAMTVVETMFHYGLLVELLGSVVSPLALQNLLQLDEELGNKPNGVLRLAVLSLYVDEDAYRISTRFKLSNEAKECLRHVLSEVPRITRDITETQAKIALYIIGMKSYRYKVLYEWAKEGASATDKHWMALFNLPKLWSTPEFPVKGRDLISLGYCKGPKIGITLRLLEKFWIQSDFKLTKKKLLQIAKKELNIY